ncbi:dihydroneopterin aldolase [Algicola sagamiensis]|uniref:dihydroneopterin aldolase n=1 Tax=Algicola sagamiensis TaxID=163869 RepID=UPI0003740719|nr:dihydroneopterin aldolase [Algicola sagamiensis]
MDRVFIQQLEVDTVIGVYEWEKEIRQQLLFDINMAWDNACPAAQDDIHLALDYAAVSERVTTFAKTHTFELIETMAEKVAALILHEFSVHEVTITLRKPGAVHNAASVGVQICRKRS